MSKIFHLISPQYHYERVPSELIALRYVVWNLRRLRPLDGSRHVFSNIAREAEFQSIVA